jgi:hypothetical protein
MADRDLTWTEFLRQSEDSSNVLKLIEWVERNTHRALDADVIDGALKLISLMLTSTHRPFRDRATRALFLIGLKHPKALFEHAIATLSFNDLYLPERALAAAYGVAMSLWADPHGANMRASLGPFARTLVVKMFLPQAPFRTRHALIRDYALNTIRIARLVDESAIPRRQLRYLRPPFNELPQPLRHTLTAKQYDDVKPALHMDFDNYTLGHLVPGRQNYDFKHPDYVVVRNQVLARMYELGYSSTRFKQIDEFIGRYHWNRGNDPNKTDRYGKKYSWIAYFEVYGYREDHGLLHDRDHARLSDCDIDPSFPEPRRLWEAPMQDLFSHSPTDPAGWLNQGPTPRYEHLLRRTSIQNVRGPWVLVDGFVLQKSPSDHRETFAFLQGLLVSERRREQLGAALAITDYPGNHAIPRAYDDYYTFAGEIPWSINFGRGLRTPSGKARRHVALAFERWNGRRTGGIPVEVPVHDFSWESHHSAMNQSGGFMTIAPALAEALGLINRARTCELFEPNGRQATLYRGVPGDDSGRLLYIRRSLLQRYLRRTKQRLAWLMWGERNFSGASGLHDDDNVRPLFQTRMYIHKRVAYF